MKKKLFTLLLLFTALIAYSQEIAKGYVYDDANSNGKKDRREAGISDVAVSNGPDVVLTDAKGFYSVPVSVGNTLFVIKPSGYKTAVDEDFIPQFYYHYK
ncbi:MAG: metallophosphoesterase, partial [Proteiniphilum sp.]|nr:metallophosphoesterase [Proteiniphilum sp.]